MKRAIYISSLFFVAILIICCFSCKSRISDVPDTMLSNYAATPTPSFTPSIIPIKATLAPIPSTPTPTPEPEHFLEGDYEYYIQDGGAVITKYHNDTINESIPDTLGEYPVVAIGDEAFRGVELYISTLPDTVTKIGDRAFVSGADTITCFVLPDSITSIGEEAFCGTKMESLTLSKNLTYMGARAFSKCNLKKIIIPEGVTYIGEEAFYYNNWGNILESVSIPSTVSYIGANAFTQHFDAVNLKISSKNEYYKIKDGALYSNDGAVLYACYYDENRTSFTTPEGVTTIAREAFNKCYNTKVFISAEVENIEEGAFPDFSVFHVEISSENRCFKIENDALLSTDGTTLIAFFGKENSFIIPNTVKRIGAKAFAWHTGDFCSIESIAIPDSVESIGDRAFEVTDLKEITIPDSVQEVGEYVFYSCDNLAKVKLSKTANEIPAGMFYGCSELSEFSFPEYITNIGDYAFSCTAIKSISIPNDVVNLGKGVFSECAALEKVSLPENFCNIPDMSFYKCSMLSDIDLPSTVQYIGDDAFCFSGLTSMNLPEKLISIGNHSFAACEAITKIAIPEEVKQIGAGAFAGCCALKGVVLPDSITYIGDSAFYNCESIIEITIPSGVKFIAPQTFIGCDNLTTVTLDEGVQQIGRRAFSYCDMLKSIYIPASVTQFDKDIFDSDHFRYSGNLTIYTPIDSAASQYASKREIPCITE